MMTNKKQPRRALWMSVISLILCCTMFVGTTFAWFTDSVTSGNNKIIAGNLDVEVTHTNKSGVEEDILDVENLFKDVTLWEPGAVAYEKLTVKNEGTLALKYMLSINFDNENWIEGTDAKLSEILQVAVVDAADLTGRDAALTAAKAADNADNLKNFVLSGELYPAGTEGKAATDTYGIVIWWEPSANDNRWNVNNDAVVNDYITTGKNELHIDLGVEVFATQLMSENDSFGPDYDGAAPWVGGVNTDWYFADPEASEFTISSAEELAGLAALVNGTAVAPASTYSLRAATETVHDSFKNKTVYLGGNIDLDDMAWTPIGRIGVTSTDFTYAFQGTFDGQDHTVSNLKVSNEGWAGLFGIAYKASIKNVKLYGVTINSNRMAGSLVGQLYGSIDNCHVEKANIMVVPNEVGDSYDNGDKVGGVVGWIGDNGNGHYLTNCSVTGAEITAYRDLGGIAGYVAYSTVVEKNMAKEVEITADQITNHYGEKDINAGAIWGRNSVSSTGDGVVASDNTDENCVIAESYVKDGLYLIGDGQGKVTLDSIPADYENTTVVVPEGVTSIGGYAFSKNSNIEKIVLPSTVTTLNDRAFRDTSASTVVLNEGLTNISYQAFRNALNVETVVIPSTVTTISKEAFQNSGITTLTIPAGVTTIEYGGCRDMKELETVVIEGNVDIPVYAFRACTNLKTVVLKGDDVTFGGGSRGMIFTNKENGDGSAITVYVANETVKERLLAADTAAKDYGGYDIIIGEPPVEVATADALVAALAAGKSVAIVADISDATIKLPATLENVSIKALEGVTLKNSTIMAADGNAISYEGLTFDGITFENSRITITGWRNNGATVKDITVTNCVFKNLDDSTNSAPVHFNMAETEPINGFTFTNNMIDGAIGGQKSGVYAQVTGKVIFTDNVINNVSFRPYVIQVTTDDGVNDEFIVTGNIFSGSAAGRAQGLGNNSEGSDTVKLVVSENIFKGITDAQQICYWSFNAEKTTADLSKNYYDIDITAKPDRIYYNSAAANVEDLVDMGVYPFYTELNADGTIDTGSLVVAP